MFLNSEVPVTCLTDENPVSSLVTLRTANIERHIPIYCVQAVQVKVGYRFSHWRSKIRNLIVNLIDFYNMY